MVQNSQSPQHDFIGQLRLDGRGIVVLGGGDGIGRQSCLALAQAGARILCVDSDADRAHSVAGEVGGTAWTANITSDSEMKALFAHANSEFGAAFKGIVNVVGVAYVKPFVDINENDWRRQFDIVLHHAYLTMRHGAPYLAENGGGSLTYVGSMSGLASIAGQTAYGAAKAALHHLVRGGANEFGSSNVRVNVVVPSFIRTPRLAAALSQEVWDRMATTTPLGRVADPTEIAGPILFLQSDLASFVSGAIFPVDGGVSALSVYSKF